MKLYVASSWRNECQPGIVRLLRELGHEVYDFRNPETAFHWSEIDPNWEAWTPEQFHDALKHQLAVAGFRSDFEALKWADAAILLLPCGRSAHLEAGWIAGAGKPLAILFAEGSPIELTYCMAEQTGGALCAGLDELKQWLASLQRKATSNG